MIEKETAIKTRKEDNDPQMTNKGIKKGGIFKKKCMEKRNIPSFAGVQEGHRCLTKPANETIESDI
jgi:hypothetical protein